MLMASGPADLPRPTSGAAACTETLEIVPARPFDLSQATAYLDRFPPTRGDQAIVGRQLCKAWQFGSDTVASQISQQPDGRLHVVLTAHTAISEALKARALDRIAFFLSVHDDISGFYAIAKSDPKVSELAERGYGYHQVKMASPAEHICWLILAHGKPVAVARRMRCAIEKHFGNTVQIGSHQLSAFPSLEQLNCLDEADLYRLAGNRRKAGYLYESLRRLAGTDHHYLRDAPIDEVRTLLVGMPGINDMAAFFFLERGLGRIDEVRAHPEALRDVSRTYSRVVDEHEFRMLARRYGPWSRYWLLYMRAFARAPEGAR
jgi:DNA-3-methyladenine glycosylase II